MLVLFDDAREGGTPPRLYRRPTQVVVANELQEVIPALERVRSGLRAGKHAAGYLAYEAGHAFDPHLTADARKGDGPLLCFGLFEGFESPDLLEFLPSPDGAFVGPVRPRISRNEYLEAVGDVREHLFAGDFYQANLTFGCDVAAQGKPLALYSRLRRSSMSGWGGVLMHDGRALISLSPEQFFTVRAGTVEARPMKGTAPRRLDPARISRASAAAGSATFPGLHRSLPCVYL